MIENPPEIDRKRVVRFLVKSEIVRGTRLVPTWVVVVTSGLVQPELHVVVRPHPFAGVDHATLERGVDVTGRDEDDRGARSDIHLPTEWANADPEPLVVADRGDLFPEPSGHLRSLRPARAWDEI